MTTYRPLSWEAVHDTADLLMNTYGTTTTLEVKTCLRNLGYWARQAEVSRLMRQIAAAEGWPYVCNGRFRIYLLPSAVARPSSSWGGLLWLN